jgi:carotenoid cleavage dioxygenase-like enzyme
LRAAPAGVAATAWAGLLSSQATPARAAEPADAWRSAYRPYDAPYRAGFDGTLEALAPRVEGRVPDGLRGTLFRNGPARMRVGASASRHWFDGDGMLHAFAFDEGRVRHRAAMIATPKLREEEGAGRLLYPGFGTALPDARPVPSPDTVNVANINVLAMRGGRDLYALWEAGSATTIDPVTLQARGFKVWSRETAGAPFGAHPRVAPDGTVWNFGYVPGSGKLVLYEIDPGGRLRRQALIDAPQADMVHDFAITERHLVFLLMPLRASAARAPGASFLDRFEWHGREPMIVLVVDKSDLRVRRMELPAGGVFHLGNAWEEGGHIRLGYVQQSDILGLMRGLSVETPSAPAAFGRSRWMEVDVDLATGRARQAAVGLEGVEFPRFDTRFTGEPTALTVMMARTPAMHEAVSGLNALVVRRGEAIARHEYPAGWIAEEHVYVPAPGAARDGAGWILGTAYHWPSERSVLSVFDAAQVADGPTARLHLPYGLPLGLHGQFVPA